LTVANVCNRNPGLGEVRYFQYAGLWWGAWLDAVGLPAHMIVSVHGQSWDLAFLMNTQHEIGWLAACSSSSWTTVAELQQYELQQQQQQGTTVNGGCNTSTVCSVSTTQSLFDDSAGILGSCEDDACVNTGSNLDPLANVGDYNAGD
jgi:hypothetical protein